MRRDFAPISYMGHVPLLVCVPVKSDFKTLKDLIAFGKANRASSTTVRPPLAARLDRDADVDGGFKMNLVTYRASPQAVTDLITGQIDVSSPISR